MLRNNRGLSLLEVMMAVGIISIVILAPSLIFRMQNNLQNTSMAFGWLDQMRTELVTSLKKEVSWEQTVLSTQNPALACLRPRIQDPRASINCKGAGGVISVVIDPSGKELLNTTNEKTGFSKKGAACDSFGTAACPMRYEISWQARCASGRADDACSNPDIVVRGQLKIEGSDFTINPLPYNFSFIVNKKGETVDATCEQGMLGTYDPVLKKCVLNINTVCRMTNEYLVGFQADGSPICRQRNVINSPCGAGQIMTGVNSNGDPICTSNTCI